MEYWKIINLLVTAPNQPSKFRTKKWAEINDDFHGICTVSNSIRFKTQMLKSSVCDFSDAKILVKGTRTITGRGAATAARQANERDKGVIFKNYAPFTKYISKKDNMQVDGAQEIDVVMPMYNLIEYSDNYWKTSES